MTKDIQAFPNTGNSNWNMRPTGGMTLRDYFAAKAMQGLCASPNADPTIGEHEWADVSYKIADAMLKAREQ